MGEDLIATANMYFSGTQKNDGRGVDLFAPTGKPRPDPGTAANYSRQWNGSEKFRSGLLHSVTRIRDRRIRTFQTPDGRIVTAGPAQSRTWQLAELFKIGKCKIHQIEAIMERARCGINSGWSTWQDGLSDRAR